MKKNIYSLILPLIVVSGLVFANREIKNETSKNSTPKPLSKPISAAEREAAMKQWYTTPGGIAYKNWEASPEGKKVLAGDAKISKQTSSYTNMEAVVISLSLPPGSQLGFGVIVRINGDDYILGYGPEKSNEFQQLHSLKVDDKIIIRSHTVSHAPKYSYPIIWFDYVERDGKIIYKRPPNQRGC